MYKEPGEESESLRSHPLNRAAAFDYEALQNIDVDSALSKSATQKKPGHGKDGEDPSEDG